MWSGSKEGKRTEIVEERNDNDNDNNAEVKKQHRKRK